MTSGSLQGLKSPGLGQGEDLLLTQLLSTALFPLRLWDQRPSGTYLPVLAPSILLGSRM